MKLEACLLVASLTIKRSTLALKNRILRITGKYPIDIEVRGKKDGKYVQIPSELCDYRHPCRKDIERLKVK